jgi:hypothetical protein
MELAPLSEFAEGQHIDLAEATFRPINFLAPGYQ